MLTTGIRTAVGLKDRRRGFTAHQEIGAEIESLLKPVNGTRTVLAERTADGYFLDLQWDRERLARYGVSVEDAQGVIENAIGGENVSTVVLGQERYRVNVATRAISAATLGRSAASGSRQAVSGNCH